MSEIARLIIESGRAAAEARAQQGALWGRAVENISQVPGQVMEQRRQQQHLDMQQQELNARLALQHEQLRGVSFQNTEAQKAAEAHAALGQAISSAAKIGPDGMLQYDIPTFLKAAQANPHVAEMMHEPADAMQKANDTYAQFKQGQAKSKADAMRAIFSGAVDAGGSPNDISIVAAPFIKEGTVTAADLQPTIDQLGQIPDAAKQRAVLRGAAGIKPTYIAGPAGGSLYQTTPGEAPSVAATAPPNPETAIGHAETARHNAAMEGIQRMQVGREAAANRETARHNQAMEQAQNPLAALTGPGGAAPAFGGTPQPNAAPGAPAQPGAGAPANVTGQDVLKKLPPPVASQVKALAEGRMAFPAGFALKSPYWQSMISLVSQYDPSFDAINYNARSKTRADFTSGKSAGQVNALNTVIGHLSDLSTAADELNNTWSPTWNSLANAVSTATGNPAVKKFDTIQNAVSDEATRVWRQAGGTEADIQAWKKDLAAAGSPEQLHGVIATIGDLLSSKLEAMQNQYQQGMGTDGVKMLTPQAEQTLQKLRAKARTGAAAPGGGQTGGVSVTSPNGKAYSFPDQAAADRFVADAKAKGLWR